MTKIILEQVPTSPAEIMAFARKHDLFTKKRIKYKIETKSEDPFERLYEFSKTKRNLTEYDFYVETDGEVQYQEGAKLITFYTDYIGYYIADHVRGWGTVNELEKEKMTDLFEKHRWIRYRLGTDSTNFFYPELNGYKIEKS